MDNPLRACVAIAGLIAVMPGCSERSPTAPGGGTSRTLTVTGIQPSSGSANTSIAVRVIGSGFQAGAVLMLGNEPIDATVVSTTLITATVPAHPAGTVDVVVTNPGPRSARLSGGFTFVPVARATIMSVAPNVGSTLGGTSITISGTDFHRAATVTVGGITVTAPFVFGGSIYLIAPAHGAGSVDVVVTNPGTEPHALNGGYTYAPPESFEFNGTWEGGAGLEGEIPLRFIVEKNQVTSVQCGGSEAVIFTTPPAVRNGEFSISEEAITMTGRILSPASTSGTIDTAACGRRPWYAVKGSEARKLSPE